MTNLLESVYHLSPVFLQNLAISIYGMKLYRERYNKYGDQLFQKINMHQWDSAEEIKMMQEVNFIGLAREAIMNVPYYEEWAKKEGVHPNDIKTLSDLERFPILEKMQVLKSPDKFINKLENKVNGLKALSTSGTTGSPLTVFTNNKCRAEHYAFFTRLRRWYGVDRFDKRATFFGRVLQKANNKTLPFWRYDKFQRNLLMSSYHLSPENLIKYVEKIVDYRPEEIIAYPSSLYPLARFIVESNIAPIKLKLIITTAEVLHPFQREMINKAFDAPVVNQYGCTEMAFFASECEKGYMHLHPEHGIGEVIDPNNEYSETTRGEFVVTGLINRVMPLIRYRIGDIVELDNTFKLCECGRSFPVIGNIDGRSDDVLYRKDGTSIGRLDPVFKGGQGIAEAQITQNSDSSIVVYVVPLKNFSSENEAWLLSQLRKRVGDDLPLRIKVVSNIEKEINGKFRSVIGNFNPNR
ncbi:phenylacetate--CoA ligase family protein [Corallibacter sp.]|uniref:phenylacetate--CoA ligase family protein n=1 Tax=Corallibacter sp. TaxID=2038084 RepID=UPI003AB7E7FA